MLDLVRCRAYLQGFDFCTLFNDLGWDHLTNEFEAVVDQRRFRLQGVAQKRGFAILTCSPRDGDAIPDALTRRQIDSQVERLAREHLVIFTDVPKTTQVWQWVRRETGRPIACRSITLHRGQSGALLAQTLQALEFSFAEEDSVTIVDATRRVRAAFDLERVTKRFYDRFKAERDVFQKFLKGIPDQDEQRWYVSVMLNRLMFIYFIQKKGFVDGDPNYLVTKLTESRLRQKDRYYRDFLCPLFFAGFALQQAARTPETRHLLGEVPYLNGGLFLRHQIEERYGERIQVADAAFERVFSFFESYRWHLDERPLRNDNEINPDVLGYIFEKYVNQKQMGAYYTKEDITGYITTSTVIPRLFDMTREKCRIAFDGEQSVWRLLRETPDRYIYAAVKRGVVDEAGGVVPEQKLPGFVQRGMHDPKERMFDRRYNLGRAEIAGPDGENLTLPTETWREYAGRRARCLELRDKLAAGGVTTIDDMITLNLGLRQFARDVVETCEGPELLRALWKALTSISVLDPTCGSGAFLFAALNTLDDLYEACLDRMQAFVDELDRSGEKHRPEKFADFRQVLGRVHEHPSRRYFVLKSIIVNNLYGVDIMEEAVEICKLRLFLKLVAQIERAEDIEPLPDIDFNIRVGNTLVGFASRQGVVDALTVDNGGQQRMLYGEVEETLRDIEARADLADRAFRLFREMQTEQGMQAHEFADAKEELCVRLAGLAVELDRLLARHYGVDPDHRTAFAAWKALHQPFHWYTEFYGIMVDGGFGAVVGNPPFVEYEKVRDTYGIRGFETIGCGNLFAFVWERSIAVVRTNGRTGLIVPVASVCADGYVGLRRLLLREGSLVVSSYNDRPSKLFDGLEHIRLSILLHLKGGAAGVCFSGGYRKWAAEERATLFERLQFVEITGLWSVAQIPKVRDAVEAGVFGSLLEHSQTVGDCVRSRGPSLYYTRKLSHFVQVVDFVPRILDEDGTLRQPSELKLLSFDDEATRDAILGALNSSLFFFFLTAVSDCRNLNKRDVLSFPAFFLPAGSGDRISALAHNLMIDIARKSEVRRMSYAGLGTLSIQCTFPRRSKTAIDCLDRELMDSLGLGDSSLDQIVNFDIKYRMGLDDEGSEEE